MNYADIEPVDGEDIRNGVLAYIALGIDTTTIRDGKTQPFSKFWIFFFLHQPVTKRLLY